VGNVVVRMERLKEVLTEEQINKIGLYKEEKKKLSTRISKQEHQSLKKMGFNNDKKMAILVRNEVIEILENSHEIDTKDFETVKASDSTVYSVEVPKCLANQIKKKCNMFNLNVSSFLRLVIQEILKKEVDSNGNLYFIHADK